MTKILLADQHRLVSSAIAGMLSQEPDFEVVAIVADGHRVLEAARRTDPDVILIEAALPGLDGSGVAAQLRPEFPKTSVLVLSSSGNTEELQRVLRCGAHGYLRKSSTPKVLIHAIRQLAAGFQVFDPDAVLEALSPHCNVTAPSARELMTLRLVASGLSNREVAARLSLSPGTVRNYISSVICKTNARNRLDAVRIAREFAWI